MRTVKILGALVALTARLLAQDTNAAAPADSAKLALARETIAAMHADKMFDGMVAQMKQMAASSASAAMPANATPEQRKAAEELQGKIMDLSMAAAKNLVGKMDQIYADVYSEAELKAMNAFFLSSEGQSMLAKQPQIMAHIMPLVQQMQRDLMPKVQQLVAQAKAAEAQAATSAGAVLPPAASTPTATPATVK